MSNSGPSSKAGGKKAAATLLVAPKKSKRRKKTERQIDADWKPSDIKKRAFNASWGSVSTLIGISSSPAKRSRLVTERTTDLEGSSSQSDDSFQFQSPDKGVTSQALVFETTDERLGLSRTLSTHVGYVSLFHSQDKVDRTRVEIPQKLENIDQILDDKNLPKSDVTSVLDAEITLASLRKIASIKSKRGSSSQRQPTNKVVTKVPANEVAESLGLDGVDWQWWHLIGHALFGDAAQNFDNFVLGKKHGNAIMNDIAESLVKTILQDTKGPDALYLSAHVSFVKGFERARLANRVTWVLKDAPGDSYDKIVKFNFDPLAIETLSKSEITAFKALLPKLFYQGTAAVQLLTPTKPLKPLDIQSPSPYLVKSKSRITEMSPPQPVLFSPTKAKTSSFAVSEEVDVPLPETEKPGFFKKIT